jgi:hypothetical protein
MILAVVMLFQATDGTQRKLQNILLAIFFAFQDLFLSIGISQDE